MEGRGAWIPVVLSAVVGVLVGLVAGMVLWRGDSTGDVAAMPQPTPVDTEAAHEKEKAQAGRLAEGACKEAVLERLKSPGSAVFGGIESVQDEGLEVPMWAITGWVDSENGFGALLRSYWSCDASSGQSNWLNVSVDDLTLLPS